jgi:hypothetical protein
MILMKVRRRTSEFSRDLYSLWNANRHIGLGSQKRIFTAGTRRGQRANLSTELRDLICTALFALPVPPLSFLRGASHWQTLPRAAAARLPPPPALPFRPRRPRRRRAASGRCCPPACGRGWFSWPAVAPCSACPSWSCSRARCCAVPSRMRQRGGDGMQEAQLLPQ